MLLWYRIGYRIKRNHAWIPSVFFARRAEFAAICLLPHSRYPRANDFHSLSPQNHIRRRWPVTPAGVRPWKRGLAQWQSLRSSGTSSGKEERQRGLPPRLSGWPQRAGFAELIGTSGEEVIRLTRHHQPPPVVDIASTMRYSTGSCRLPHCEESGRAYQES